MPAAVPADCVRSCEPRSASGAASFESLARQSKRWEALQVGSCKLQLADRGKIEPFGRRRHPLGPREGISDRNAHVRATELRKHRAVDEFDHRMNYGLRMNHHVELAGW